ncbi:MAG TPA: hypothetical protein VJR89_12400 [Polyangiales bacterium]|nr:hypothetical protein [Polyangiales bacterium]
MVGKLVGLALLASLAVPHAAHACVRVPLEFYAVEPELRAVDSEAPTPFRDVVARVDRRPAVVCRNDECTSDSCGSAGTIALRFQPPRDDQNDAPSLGYRVVWLRGEQPRSARAFLEHDWPLGPRPGEISLTLAYDDVAELDAEIALVALDRAGNESEPSEPIHLEFSGCTLEIGSDRCLETGCSVGRVAAHGGHYGFGALLGVGLALLGLKRFRRAVRGRASG